MNVDECKLIRALLYGWPLRDLIANFESAKHSSIQGGRIVGGRGIHASITRKGLVGTVGEADGDRVDERPVRITWGQLRRWIAAMPADVHAEAVACRDEWAAICHLRAPMWMPGQSWPSWQECYDTPGPLTERAALAVECDRREADLNGREDALCDRVLTDWAPTDLFDLLPAGAAS